LDEKLREALEDAVVRALEAGVAVDRVREEVEYAISIFGSDD
jgi:hypothetical protein